MPIYGNARQLPGLPSQVRPRTVQHLPVGVMQEAVWPCQMGTTLDLSRRFGRNYELIVLSALMPCQLLPPTA